MLILWAGCNLAWPSACSGHRLQVSVLVAVDEAEPLDRPVQPAFSQLVFSRELAGGISLFRARRIILAAGVRAVDVVDIAGARHDEPRLGRMSLCCGDEVARAFEIALPDQVGVGRAEDRGEMDDRRDALHRPCERRRIEQVARHGRTPAGTLSRPRTSARQSTPASTRRGRSRAPTSPVTPVTKIVMCRFLSAKAYRAARWRSEAR